VNLVGAGGSAGGRDERSMELAGICASQLGLNTMLHLTCIGLSRDDIRSILMKAKESGIRSILALRGDPPRGATSWTPNPNGFKYAAEMVKFIRKEFESTFAIGVAGFPEGHPESPDDETYMRHLKEKVDCGADFIMTQLFFDPKVFFSFTEKCKQCGIDVPIVPGIMPIHSYRIFKNVIKLSNARMPESFIASIEKERLDEDAVRGIGLRFMVALCRTLINAGVPYLHVYTMNLERATSRLVNTLHLGSHRQLPELPWVPAKSSTGQIESIRPIFWNIRPSSYVDRIADLEDFPNGRWGDAADPAFGDVFHTHHAPPIAAPDHPVTSISDVIDLVIKFFNGTGTIPWCEACLQAESSTILTDLMFLVRRGFITTNSQPSINAVLSTDPVFGWGKPGGYIFQKAYLELFLSERRLNRFLELAKEYPSLTYMACSAEGSLITNSAKTNAVSWGVFPGSEVLQPTVVDGTSFLIWRDEAFEVVRNWAASFPLDDPSHKYLIEFAESAHLLNVVENNFVEGDILDIFKRILNEEDELVKEKEESGKDQDSFLW
jgi:methylenetetrahydrofolate reductase (NADPH)